MGEHPTGAGHSSFSLVDARRFFHEIGVKPGETVLDLGCGRGEFAAVAAEMVDETGRVYAYDLWKEGIESLKRSLPPKTRHVVQAETVDAAGGLPLADRCLDLAYMTSVFHDFAGDGIQHIVVRELRRTLKNTGRLAVLDFQKKDGPPGPPVTSRLSPEETTKQIEPHGFVVRFIEPEIEPHHYLILFDPV
jgi:ubiquinone/menaquinone biosynthesis C-methylase UbiE